MKKDKFGIVYILLSALFFALGGILIKINTWSSISINGMRCLFAFFVMLIYMKSISHKFKINKAVILGAAANLGMNLAFTMANKMTSAANAIVLQFTQPVFIILFLWIFWKKRPDRGAILACLASFAGIMCFFFDSLTASGMMGNLVAILSGILYAIVFLIKKMPDSDFESSVVLSFAASFLISIPFLLQETSVWGINLASAAALGILQTGCAFVCLAKGLESVAPVTASLTSMIEPIANPILVAVFYGETIGIPSMIGAAVVLGSATVYNVATARKAV